MDLNAPPESRGVPPTAGIGKSAGDEAAEGMRHVTATGSAFQGEKVTVLPPATKSAPVAASFKAVPEEEGHFADAEVYKGFKKMRKKLGKKVLSGSMTVDEARTKLGRQFAQKGTEDPQEAVQKGLLTHEEALALHGLPPQPPTAEPIGLWAMAAPPAAADPEMIKTAVAEATSELKDLLIKQQETFTTKLAEQQKVIDAIADQPDPSTASFSGLAFNPVRKAARPAGVAETAEIAERTQQMMIRHLQDKYNASSDPAEREAYYGTLAKMRGMGQ